MANNNQQEHFSTSMDNSAETVECLGMTFPNDEARRAYFIEILREKLKVPEFRKIEGFPIGEDEDILALSDPPYYTACPNPFIEEFICRYGTPYDPTVAYKRIPFSVDVSEGKTDPLYKAHAYHTKVPHLAIVPSILHYTVPGDIVLDGFCGSGMTGVAVQWCCSAPKEYRSELEARWKKSEQGVPQWGLRRVVLNDLSPAATFITANYTRPVHVDSFQQKAETLLEEVKKEVGWMYQTIHTDGKTVGEIDYTVWSEIFSCADCSKEVVFLDEALDKATKRVRDSFPCPHCGVSLTKSQLERVFEVRLDKFLNQSVKAQKRKPVLIVYKVGKDRFEKEPTPSDIERLQKIESTGLQPYFPLSAFPFDDMWEAPRLLTRHITHVHQMFFDRSAHALSAFWMKALTCDDNRVRMFLVFLVEQAICGMSVLNRYQPIMHGHPGGSQVNRYLSGVYYVGSQIAEVSPWYILDGKLDRLVKAFRRQYSPSNSAITSTGDTSSLPMAASSIDYIFTDPPFGDNIPYSELNYVVESFLKVMTDAKPEAVVERGKKNQASQKGLVEYQRLMERCFSEYFRVLKPGRWITVVFSNSKNAVWTAIQEAMARAGFIVADVRTLDKQQQSFKQVTSIAVKQDLVISAYKPTEKLEAAFKIKAGTEIGVWDFVRTHLDQLPVFVSKGARAEIVAERTNHFLFDRMVAFHVQRGYSVPMSIAEFYEGLRQRFSERESMYFLPEQASDYDRKRFEVKEMEQFELFVNDEKSAIQWVRLQLAKKPTSFEGLQPLYMKQAQRVWEKHEQPLELQTILEQNFVKDDDGTWRVPNPKKEADLEQMRHRVLMKEFQQYLDTKGKLKIVRTEALRAGFKECWQKKDYATIVQMAKRVPEAVIQEDPALLMYVDNASLMLGE